jgi:CheY-like chemotaxis protein
LSSSTPGPKVPSGSWMPTVNRYDPRFLSKEGTIRPQQIPVQIPTGNLSAIARDEWTGPVALTAGAGGAVPINYCTAEKDADGRLRRRLLQAGAMAVLYEPVDPEQLLRLVEDALRAG